jgi:phospholipase C
VFESTPSNSGSECGLKPVSFVQPLGRRTSTRAPRASRTGATTAALVVSPFLRGNFVVDHTQYDTTSIFATIERRWGLDPRTTRDAGVNDLSHVFAASSTKRPGRSRADDRNPV